MLVWHVREGHFGDVPLDGFNLLVLGGFEGNLWAGAEATLGLFIDERADERQRQALQTISFQRRARRGIRFQVDCEGLVEQAHSVRLDRPRSRLAGRDGEAEVHHAERSICLRAIEFHVGCCASGHPHLADRSDRHYLGPDAVPSQQHEPSNGQRVDGNRLSRRHGRDARHGRHGHDRYVRRPLHQARHPLRKRHNGPARPTTPSRDLNRVGKLNDPTVNRSAIRAEAASLFTALSVLSGAPIEIIEQVMTDADCEGLIMACRAARLNWQTTLAILSNRGGSRLSFEQRERASQDV